MQLAKIISLALQIVKLQFIPKSLSAQCRLCSKLEPALAYAKPSRAANAWQTLALHEFNFY